MQAHSLQKTPKKTSVAKKLPKRFADSKILRVGIYQAVLMSSSWHKK